MFAHLPTSNLKFARARIFFREFSPHPENEAAGQIQ